MRPQDIPELQCSYPPFTRFTHKMKMMGPMTICMTHQPPSFWEVGITFRGSHVAKTSQRLEELVRNVHRFHRRHHVNYRFCRKARNCCAPDMLNIEKIPSKNTEKPRLFAFEFLWPLRVIRRDTDILVDRGLKKFVLKCTTQLIPYSALRISPFDG